MMRKSLLLFGLLISSFSLFAQGPWTLQDCIKYAEENSIAIKQAQLNIQSALLDKRQSQLSRIPSLNGSISAGEQFGRTIDPTTNSFDNQAIGFNTFRLESGVLLFGGNRVNKSIQSAKTQAEIARLDGETAANNLRLNVASAYLNILLAEESLRNAKNRMALSERQLDQVNKFIKAGSRPANDRLSVQAQLAIDNQAVIQAQNGVDIAYLSLRNLLLLPDDKEFSIVEPDLAEPDEAALVDANFPMVYSAAMNTQPQIKSAETQVKAASIFEDIEKSGYYPSLSAFARLTSNWSSAAKTITGFTSETVEQDIFFQDNPNDPITIGISQMVPIREDQPYWDQLEQNFGQTVGLSLNIPIYNNHDVITRSQKAEINTLRAENNAELARQQLKTDVQNAVANAKAARETFAAAKLSLEANRIAFDNAEKQFNLGAISTFELGNSRTNLDLAQTEFIRSKYDYIFRLKIVEFYLGRDLKF
ncbi:MAG: TolC family protein [Saprospiraceae bacterium]|nr:TolC family protein [Saprospiraceae bacterium]